ncbi:trimeric intracellular cation channel family protein [Sinomonas sp. ASV486]|uniref:Trimeric intracellular cation channel family protein n=1 Tax=Sinomonas puerhi TaxID=3238584 RepID=A0AB39L3H2_9MICC|nr:trimeric intracellular cation channel family protein [Sinomonas sp. ASV486]MDQ4491558.1 trimeric intracellular cation channel family protein [Sinomonas sp. ASV486]
MNPAEWALAVDLLGVFFFAVSGCMMAAQKGYDIVGSVLLGALTGIGGGVIRDLVLNRIPNSLAQPIYLAPPVVAAIVVYFLMPAVQKLRRTVLFFDAGGLALFCVTGTLTALGAGINPVSAAVLGTVTAIGGGLMRDTVANVRPGLFDRHDIYAVPAMFGAGLVALLSWLGAMSTTAGFLVAVAVFAFRVLALRLRWRVPLAASSRHESKRASAR